LDAGEGPRPDVRGREHVLEPVGPRGVPTWEVAKTHLTILGSRTQKGWPPQHKKKAPVALWLPNNIQGFSCIENIWARAYAVFPSA